MPPSIARFTQLMIVAVFFVAVIIASGTMKLDQNLVRLTP